MRHVKRQTHYIRFFHKLFWMQDESCSHSFSKLVLELLQGDKAIVLLRFHLDGRNTHPSGSVVVASCYEEIDLHGASAVAIVTSRIEIKLVSVRQQLLRHSIFRKHAIVDLEFVHKDVSVNLVGGWCRYPGTSAPREAPYPPCSI